jgi:hypothetical protein
MEGEEAIPVENIVLWIIIAAVQFLILYWVVKRAIDRSETSYGLKRIYQVLIEIREELKKRISKYYDSAMQR